MKDGFSGERSIVMPRMIRNMVESDPLASMLYITDIGYYPKAAHHYRCREVPIDQYVFIYCVDGRGHFTLDRKTYNVMPDQYFILPPGVPHSYGADVDMPWTIYWIHFKGPLAEYYASEACMSWPVNSGMNSRISHRVDLFEEIFNVLNSGFNIAGVRYAMSIFHHYLGSLIYVGRYREAAHDSGITDMIDATINYMTRNVEKHLSLAEIAAYSGFSQSHLSMLFKQRTGHSPLSYFNLLKVRQACDMLDNTNMKVTQICYKVGFSDPYYFSRMFNKVMGLSPQAYRKQQKV